MYAHVTNGTVDAVGNPPQLVEQGGRWWDLRDRDPVTLALVGWFPVTETAKPADTATTTWVPVFTPGDGDVDQSWSEIPKTAEQLAAETESANRQTIETALSDALTELQTLIDTTNATINAGPAPYIKALARALRRVIRLLIRRFDGTA